MTLKLINNKQISWINIIKAIIYKKLLPAGNGIIHFETIMDMHIHDCFFFVQMGNCIIFAFQAFCNGRFTCCECFDISYLLFYDKGDSTNLQVGL